jgi:hypothetical protein
MMTATPRTEKEFSSRVWVSNASPTKERMTQHPSDETVVIPVAMTYGDPLPQRGRADVLFRVLTGGVTAPEVIRSIRLVEDVQN